MSEIHFYCVYCGEGMRAAMELAGAAVECGKCRREAPAPGCALGVGETLSALPTEVLGLDVTFRCQGCERKLVIDARWEGVAVECPVCKSSVTVPRWSGRPVRTGFSRGAAPILTAEEIDFLSAASYQEAG
jgi:hypothetical protein